MFISGAHETIPPDFASQGPGEHKILSVDDQVLTTSAIIIVSLIIIIVFILVIIIYCTIIIISTVSGQGDGSGSNLMPQLCTTGRVATISLIPTIMVVIA